MSCHSLTSLEVQDAEGEGGRAARRVLSEKGMCWVGVDGRGRGGEGRGGEGEGRGWGGERRGGEVKGKEATSTCSMCSYVHILFQQLAYTCHTHTRVHAVQ